MYFTKVSQNNIVGLADEDGDVGETNNDEEMQTEVPLPMNNKPFVVKKFRDALRKADYITGIYQHIYH